MPVTRPGMHMNEVSMNAAIKKGAKEQVSRHLSDYALTASPTANLGRESWENNECAIRWTEGCKIMRDDGRDDTLL